MSATLIKSDEATLRELIAAWSRALEAKDPDGLTEHYTDDSVLFDVKPPAIVRGKAAIRQLWTDCLPFFPQTFRSEHKDLELTVGKDLAIFHALHRLVIPNEPNHPAGQSYLRVTGAFQKRQGQWTVLHEHVSFPVDCCTGQMAPIPVK